MKTKNEIRIEAREIQVRAEYLHGSRSGTERTPIPPPIILKVFPMASNGAPEEHYVDFVVEKRSMVFRLVERESLTDPAPSVLMSSKSAFEILRSGYELVEGERLAIALLPYAELSSEKPEPADRDTIYEIEEILEVSLLSPHERVQTRSEIVDFLEGRSKPSDFIFQAIERQCARQLQEVRQTSRHELKLTIGEP